MSIRSITSARSLVRSAVVVAALAPAVAFVGPANALGGGCGAGGAVTAHVSDSTPASGEQFVVRGKVNVFGMTTANQVVKVQTFRNGSWEAIKGARVLTNDEGKYRVRLILNQTGDRTLRVVAVGHDGDPNMYNKFHVSVQ